MNDVEKLDQPCSCTLVEVVVKVSHPFTLVSDRQSDNCPLLVCKPIAHTASRVLSPYSCLNGRHRHYLPLPDAYAGTGSHLEPTMAGHGPSLRHRALLSTHNFPVPMDSCGLGHDGCPTTTSPTTCHYASLLTPFLPSNISSGRSLMPAFTWHTYIRPQA